jgi:putative glycosyltransferase (TIGR04372 family)
MLKFVSKQITDIKKYGSKEFFKKFFLFLKFFSSIPIFIVAILCWLIIVLIRPWILIRIDLIPSTNFGYFVLTPALYSCKKKLNIDQPNKRHIDLLCINEQGYKNYNKQIEKMWKREFNFFPSFLLKSIYIINKFMPFYKIPSLGMNSRHTRKMERDVDNLVENYKPLNFTSEEEELGKQMLKKFGLNENDKFVCLTVRDSCYQKKKFSSRDTDLSHHNFRNHDINDFVLGAEELTKRGYYVFRMGVAVEKRINTNNSKVIDYPFSQYKSDFMDIYLGAKCSFCISTGTGYDEVPYAFGKHIAFLVLPVGEFRTHSEKFLLLTKHHYLINEKRKLSLSEIFSHGLAYTFDSNDFKKKGIELIDYTPEEIKEFILEMTEIFENKVAKNQKIGKLQLDFRKSYESNLKNLNFEESKKSPYFIPHKEIRSYFSTKFLQNNTWWLK